MSSRQALKKAEWPRPNNRQAGRKKKEEARDVARSGARIARAAQPTAELILNRDAALPQIARTSMPDLLTVPEVGAYLRLKTRAIYELVRTDQIPCCKVSGKLLFPKRSIDYWLARSMNDPRAGAHFVPAPSVIVGSNDPLLEWSLRETDCQLAFLGGGSDHGLARFSAGEAVAAAIDLADPITENEVWSDLGNQDCIVVEWAKREQGLLLASSKGGQIGGLADLAGELRHAAPWPGLDKAKLLAKLLKAQGLSETDLRFAGPAVRTDADLVLLLRKNQVDAGLAIRATAYEVNMPFVNLAWQRFDLVIRRFEYFERPMQKLLGFAQTQRFRERAAELTGYDIAGCGRVVFNAPGMARSRPGTLTRIGRF